MNDQRDPRRGGHRAEPAWPTGEDPDLARPSSDAPQERTGFWSPLWDDDDDDVPPRNARPSARPSNGRQGAAGQQAERARRWPQSLSTPTSRALRPAGSTASIRQGAGQAPGSGRHAAGRPPGGAPPGRAGQPPQRAIPEGPTEFLPPAPGQPRPEPELLTHRELDYDEPEEHYDDYDEDPEADADTPLTDEQRKRRRKKIWRRIRRTLYVFTILMIIGPILAFFIAYQLVEVPTPEQVAAEQGKVVRIMYANYKEGEEPLAEIAPSGSNRELVQHNEIPEQVKRAVYAAEDASFETNAGFDLTAVMRAAWNQATGGTGGGSTITQQYIKQATGEDASTGLAGLTRKALEVVKAYKMNETYKKEDIITAYLNTIYFGRGAYGIKAAAKAYFNKDLNELSYSESALLAGMIQSPSRFQDQEYMERRWNYVMDQLVANKWLPEQDRAEAEFPKLYPLKKALGNDAVTDARAHIREAVYAELGELMGVGKEKAKEKAQLKGYTIETTIRKGAQKLAANVVKGVMKGQPKNLRPALVAVNPKNGEVVAYYGGKNGLGIDWAKTRQEPGSSFKVFDLVALLRTGEGLGKSYDGSSPRTIAGQKVRNSDGMQCREPCYVSEAMEQSINTVFYEMAVEVGTGNVADAACDAGIQSLPRCEDPQAPAPDANISIGGGQTQVSTFEMASAYATFASDGMYREPHLIRRVLNPDGSVAYEPSPEERPAFAEDDPLQNQKIARNVTHSLEPVLEYSDLECDPTQSGEPRPCAGKTGTHQYGETDQNAKAWMVGYTPQISTAVSMSTQKGGPIRDANKSIIYGSGLPGEIWKTFMDKYLKGKPAEQFGPYEGFEIGTPAPEETYSPPPDSGEPENPDESTDPSSPETSDTTETTTEPEEPTTTTDPGFPTITFPNNDPGNGRGGGGDEGIRRDEDG